MQGDAANGSSTPQGELSRAAQSARSSRRRRPRRRETNRSTSADCSRPSDKLTTMLTDLLNKNGAGGQRNRPQTRRHHEARLRCFHEGIDVPDEVRCGRPRTRPPRPRPPFRRGAMGSTCTSTFTPTPQAGWRDRAHAGSHADARASDWRGEPRTHAPSERTDAQGAGKGEARTHVTASETNGSLGHPRRRPAAQQRRRSPQRRRPRPRPLPPPNRRTARRSRRSSRSRAMSDSAIRDAVINGRISPEVAKDQTAMMAIQQRMQRASRR